MKSILSRPVLAIFLTLVIAVGVGAAVLPRVGNAPKVSLPSLSSAATSSLAMPGLSTQTASGTPIQLAFQAAGRIAAVNVHVGDAVAKGDILASLDGAVALASANQAKAALDLAKAQYSSVSLQYTNAKTQQDTLVNNAYRTLLSSGLQARPIGVIDESHNPAVSGTYSCSKEGSYEVDVFPSGAESGYSFTLHGLEEGAGGKVTYGAPQQLGSCGLYITFVRGLSGADKWTIEIPNTQSSTYQSNKNAYDLAVSTRQQTLSQLAASIGQGGAGTDADTGSAAIAVAQSAYESALAQYANTVIRAPAAGTVAFIDSSLKVGQSVSSNQRVITINTY